MKTTQIRIGAAESATGSLSVGYMLEHRIVSLHASDPRDKRKAGITMLLSQAEYAQLKALLLELDEFIAGNQAVKPVSAAAVASPMLVHNKENKSVRVTTSAGPVTISTAVALKAKEIALMESRAEAIRYVAMGLPYVSKTALAEAIEELVKEPKLGDA